MLTYVENIDADSIQFYTSNNEVISVLTCYLWTLIVRCRQVTDADVCNNVHQPDCQQLTNETWH